jgi:hypothetical protein
MNAASTHQIPRQEWNAYFGDLASQYRDWATTVEVLDETLGDQRVIDGLPLQGVTFETAGSQAGDILIEVGDAGTPFETHLVHRPKILRASDSMPGAEVNVELETEDGQTHLISVRRRRALPPKSRK